MESAAERRKQSLPLGEIPPEFHYEGYRQSQLWLKVAQRHAPSGLGAFYQTAFACLPLHDKAHLVGLGAGGGWKEAWLQARLGASRFTPVDVSVSLALLSARRLQQLIPQRCKPLVADITKFPDLPEWLSQFDSEEPRLFSAFGLTPNLPPEELDPILKRYLRPQDQLLISANLLPGGRAETILPQYDNAETRAWLRELLTQWGLAPHLTELEIQMENLGDGQAAVVATSRWRHDVELEWEETLFQAHREGALRVFRSLRYTPEGFAHRLGAQGLSIVASRISSCEQEGLWLVQ
jgi:hypothetical protein